MQIGSHSAVARGAGAQLAQGGLLFLLQLFGIQRADFNQSRAVERRISPKDVKQYAERRQQQDHNDPWNFIGRIVVLPDQPDDDAQADKFQKII